MNIFDQLIASDDELKKTLGTDIKHWSSFDHTKADLEFMLGNTVCELAFTTKDGSERSIICTSNIPLINALSAKTSKDAEKFLSAAFAGIRTAALDSVDTWDLEAKKRKTIILKNWHIVLPHLVTLKPENVKLLHKLIQQLLK